MIRTGLYIHFPFCLKKCLYCDFNSAASSILAREEYPQLLVREMELRQARLAQPVQATTLYLGGGTPSLMAPAEVAALIDAAAARFSLAPDAEITLEANPGTLTLEKLSGYRSAGVNRISLGIQSFEDRLLEMLGRVHSRQEALDAFEACRKAGFDNVSIDLMHSLPGQSPAQWRQALADGIALAPEHISAYALSVEEETPFEALVESGNLTLPGEEDAAAMFEATAEVLGKGGYRHYEISNFARPGRQSRHNGAYWTRQSYLGFGAGAHSFWNDNGMGERWHNAEGAGEYREAVLSDALPEREREVLNHDQAVSEAFFLGLRVLAGLDLDQLEKDYGASALASRLEIVDRLVAAGQLVREGSRIRLAPQAIIVANRIFAEFL
ncbi:coproporphyrinogen III oxidase [Geomonas silvestris]|uniref:Heme chaperone HemW n=1 Tax=Geomonas silvestris TaxID=2740184 RepID=A0A6V8MI52_9BACT|nr:radical SAM family heme chaperone HemW [Geomonas silvestris]GFO59614.1 coproporphyrinogen III oxidase [Geomonas silvestris]